jgi:AcrR family transcriptional regulator
MAPTESGRKTDRHVELMEKHRPKQARAIKTYEAILSAASELLVEVGLERISTNLIAERAGITVPALYRYFPNKYSVLNALGARLMDHQNLAFAAWHETHVAGKPASALMSSIKEMLQETYEATRELTGGLEIMHGMQVLAPLQEVRLDSHWNVAETFGRFLCEEYDVPFTEDLARRVRIAVEIGFCAVQIALEDSRMDPDVALQEGAIALRLYLEHIADEAGIDLD